MGAQQPTDGFEFDAYQNDTFIGLAASMRFVTILMMIVGVLASLGALGTISDHQLVKGLASLADGVVAILVGWWLLGASKSIAAIATTEGRDIEKLLAAMAGLGRAYTLQKIALIVTLVISLLSLPAVFMAIHALKEVMER